MSDPSAEDETSDQLSHLHSLSRHEQSCSRHCHVICKTPFFCTDIPVGQEGQDETGLGVFTLHDRKTEGDEDKNTLHCKLATSLALWSLWTK